MGDLNPYLRSALVIWVMMTVLWVVSLWLRNLSIVDIFWGAGFCVVNGVAALAGGEALVLRTGLLLVLVTLWGLRLSLYIRWRNRSKPEDYRYA